jgi:hypothetical protein
MPDYEKADANIARLLMVKVDDAIANTEWVAGRAQQNDYNPYTSVHHLMKHFDAVSGSAAG